ncbi:hypothetical protein PYW08_005398 [Mythimna loreyi]|uniref:Uncharacterized protein n=1 Tax=Mythimna loreyi TaxID=667449 RepID=A0ACC2QGK8_9NEOP|nr:hypothetical protein PYW08_005398 [Mythimna loreyi]
MNSTIARRKIKEIQSALHILVALQLTAHLWPKQAQIQDGDCFDFIIIGAGTAGSVIANRLTEVEDATVLIVETGGDPPLESVIPGLFFYLKKTSFDWDYATEDDGFSQQFHRNKVVELTRGKLLGGSSSINFEPYTRGNPHDFDDWAKITGDDS